MIKRSNKIQELNDNLANTIFGTTQEKADKLKICINCKLPALERCYSENGKKEYNISGLCEICFDEMFQ